MADRIGAALLREVLIRSLRGSLLIGGAMLLITSSGLWQYLSSSFDAHDLRRAAAWAAAPAAPGGVVLVAIDDAGFEGHFGGRSPLDRARLVALLEVVHASAPGADAIVVDLDLSPPPGDRGEELVAFFGRHDARRWLLADPVLKVPDPDARRAAWREAICQAGVRLASPFLPTAFGYASPSHQYVAGLAAAAVVPGRDCAAQQALLAAEAGRLSREPAPLGATWLRDGVVVPFSGDLATLRLALAGLQPRVVVVGGAWGRLDVAGTPFGERIGAHVHAAAIDGRLQGQRLAPRGVQLVAGWLGVAMLSLLLTVVYQRLVAWVGPWGDTLPGHRFLMTRLWPLALVAITLGGVLLLAEALAVVHARTGFWVPSAMVATTVAVSVLFVWNWGLNRLALEPDLRSAWRNVFVAPMLGDARGAAEAWRVLRAGGGSMGRGRAAAEGLMAAASLSSQTLFPMAALVYAMTQPL